MKCSFTPPITPHQFSPKPTPTAGHRHVWRRGHTLSPRVHSGVNSHCCYSSERHLNVTARSAQSHQTPTRARAICDRIRFLMNTWRTCSQLQARSSQHRPPSTFPALLFTLRSNSDLPVAHFSVLSRHAAGFFTKWDESAWGERADGWLEPSGPTSHRARIKRSDPRQTAQRRGCGCCAQKTRRLSSDARACMLWSGSKGATMHARCRAMTAARGARVHGPDKSVVINGAWIHRGLLAAAAAWRTHGSNGIKQLAVWKVYMVHPFSFCPWK